MRFPILLILILVISSCNKGELEQVHSDVIGWSVLASSAASSQPSSKALINDYNQLKDACNEHTGGVPQKIGLFGSCSINGASELVFDNEDLWWWAKDEGNPFKDYEGNDSNWNYPGENKNWKDDADYVFKAYFPKGEVDLHPSSDAKKLLIMYDASKQQYDLLVAHKGIKARAENPVVLQMDHPLAALKFDLTIVESAAEDYLVCCWLENILDGGIYTSSTLNYTNEMVWPQSTPVGVGIPMYYWEPYNPVKITSTDNVVAYYSAAENDKGALYTHNDGWILLIPQQCKGPEYVRFCFRTSRGGSKVYSVGLPVTEFLCGYRYSYHVKMSAAKPEISLKVTDWNGRKSSYDVDFN